MEKQFDKIPFLTGNYRITKKKQYMEIYRSQKKPKATGAKLKSGGVFSALDSFTSILIKLLGE